MKNLTAKILLLANIPALVGLFFFGWELKQVIILYWLETIVIGILSILKTLIARAGPDVADWLAPYGKMVLGAYRLLMAVMVTILVGTYTLVTGLGVIFLLYVEDYGFRELPDGITPPDYFCAQIAAQNVWPALWIICLSHAISFIYNFFIKKEYRTNQDRRQMEILARRVGAILYTLFPAMILFAIIISLEGLITGNAMRLLQKGPTALLILIKTYFDYRGHREEHDPKNRPEE